MDNILGGINNQVTKILGSSIYDTTSDPLSRESFFNFGNGGGTNPYSLANDLTGYKNTSFLPTFTYPNTGFRDVNSMLKSILGGHYDETMSVGSSKNDFNNVLNTGYDILKRFS